MGIDKAPQAVPPAPESAEAAPKLEWSRQFRGYYSKTEEETDRLNSQLREGGKLWRMPTKEELVEAITNGEVDYGDYMSWYWSGTKLSDEDAKRSRELGFPHEDQYYVVKHNGEVDTPALSEYGFRLVRDKS